MMPRFVFVCVALLAACGPAQKSEKVLKAVPAEPTISMFYASPSLVRDGVPTKLCYAVEGATKLTLDPPVERVWPALSRCFDISPKQNTTYTLTAENATGMKASAKTAISVGPPAVKIIEVSVNSLEIKAGEAFPFCVKASNAASWKLSGGQWRTAPGPSGGCAVDHPSVTTTYVITAVGGMGETDTQRVTAKVK